ncbi:MAG: glycosyltransferase family 2 protein, partial [Planctomycetota bacterium]
MASFLAATALLATLAVGAYVHPRMRRIASLEPVSDAAAADGPAPTVALVVAARDEADAVERAVRSLLAQADTFPPGALAVVAVDDRSSDGTAAILDRLAAENDALRAVHVEALPDGWLGKNHALHLGAEAAGDVDFLLFTDADVEFEPGAVRAVAAHAWTNDLDHLAGGPRVVARSFALQGMIATFGVLFALFTRPWSHGDPRRDTACGVGALNLVRRTAYERAGGHAAIRLFVDDDLRLGRAV